MKKPLLTIVAAICAILTARSQDFPYGQINVKELNMPRYAKDTTAHAVVLNEFGSTKINMYGDDYTRVIHEYHVRIKIFDDKAFDKATVEVLFQPGNAVGNEETVTDVKGITIYANDRGDLQTAELDQSKVVSIKENKYWNSVKFTMPNVRKGCIIEYTYKFISPFFDRFPNWNFQDDIPKMRSEYQAHIPGFWEYNVSIRGSLKLTSTTSDIERDCYTTHGAHADCSFLTYSMTDIPAFVEEDYMTSPKNYKSALYFQAVNFKNPYDGSLHKYTNEWKDVDLSFKRAEYFGGQLRKSDPLKQYILPVIAGKTTDLDKAKAVYAYIQKSIKWNEFTGIGSDNLKKALESHSGSVGDINLALISALNTAGIKTDAVLLSTRKNGFINRLYPVDDDFNYVIARATVGTDTCLLDATDPLMPFGMLPLRCLNDQGRVMSFSKPSEWIDLKVNQKLTSTSSLDLSMQPDGKLKGAITIYSAGYEAYDKRTEIKKFNTVDEYVENLDEKLTKIKILKANIQNLDSLDNPLAEKYEVEIDLSDNTSSPRRAFNPVIMDRFINNPFKLTERNYPVDMGIPTVERYTLLLHLPAGYGVESAPQPVSLALPNRGGQFLTETTNNGGSFSYSNVFQLNHALYMPEEYPYLKEFYK